jgi:hypothetical protein
VPHSSPSMASLVIALPDGGSRPRKLNGLFPAAPRCRRRSGEGATFPRWGLGFRQCSFHLIRRALRSGALASSSSPPLFRHALVPFDFRRQVFNPARSADGPETFLRVPPGCARDSAPHHAAHTLTAHGSPVSQHRSRPAAVGVGSDSAIRIARFPKSFRSPDSPVPLRRVAGFPDLGLLRGLRCHRARAP